MTWWNRSVSEQEKINVLQKSYIKVYIYNIFVVPLQCEIKINDEPIKNKIKWNELKRQALKHGFRLVKHGQEHDEYHNPATGVTVQIERHGSQEVRKGLATKLRKQIGF